MADGRITLDELMSWLQEFARLIAEHRSELSELDAAIGDGDHGTNMDRGMQAVVANLGGATVGDVLKQAGMTLVSTVGGASGPLYGTFFLRFATAAGAGTELDPTQFAAAMRAGLEGIVARGKAEAGDKTMFDAMAPAIDALDAKLADGGTTAEATAAAAVAAAAGRDATIELVARKGRASYLGERSAGHMDPGSASTTLLFETLVAAVAA